MAGVSVTVGGNFSKLDELQKKSETVAQKIKDGFAQRVGHKMFDGLVSGAERAFSAVTEGIKGALDAGGALVDSMARTGAAGAGLVVMEQMFKNAGLAGENVAPSLNKMQKALAGVNEDGEPTSAAFQKIGLSIAQLVALDPVVAFQQIGESIASIPDPAKRAEAAISIFGKQGAALLAVMTDSSAWDTAKQQVGSLANTLTQSAQEMDGASDGVGALDNKMKQLYATLAVSLLPTINDFLKKMESVDGKQTGAELGIITQAAMKLGGSYRWLQEQWMQKMGVNSALTAVSFKYSMSHPDAQKTWNSGGSETEAELAQKRLQIAAEAEHASAVRQSEIAYQKAREAYDAYVTKTQETGSNSGSLADQLGSLVEAEKNIRSAMSFPMQANFGEANSKAMADALAKDSESETKGKDMEQVKKLAELEAKRLELTAKKAEEDATAAAKREDALTAYNDELGILKAQIEGGAEKILQLQREAALHEEIKKLASAGITGDEANSKAAAIVDAKLAELKRQAEVGGLHTKEDAVAASRGPYEQEVLAQKRRSKELQLKTGMKAGQADDIAANETDLMRLSRLKSEQEGLQFQSTLGRVSDMQRVGGGGGVVDSGLDYARQSADLQRQMVQLLGGILARSPNTSLEF